MEKTVFYVVVAGAIMAVALLVVVLSNLTNEIRRMRMMLESIASHVGVPELLQLGLSTDAITDSLRSELEELVSSGKSIQAIRRVRVVTGWGLAEAKQYVDRLPRV